MGEQGLALNGGPMLSVALDGVERRVVAGRLFRLQTFDPLPPCADTGDSQVNPGVIRMFIRGWLIFSSNLEFSR
jgi:hypothetical protein